MKYNQLIETEFEEDQLPRTEAELRSALPALRLRRSNILEKQLKLIDKLRKTDRIYRDKMNYDVTIPNKGEVVLDTPDEIPEKWLIRYTAENQSIIQYFIDQTKNFNNLWKQIIETSTKLSSLIANGHKR